MKGSSICKMHFQDVFPKKVLRDISPLSYEKT